MKAYQNLFILTACLMMCLLSQAQVTNTNNNPTQNLQTQTSSSEVSVDTTPSSTSTKITENNKSSAQSQNPNSAPVKPIITGEFHKANLKKIVGFKSPQVIGQEKTKEVINTFEAGKPVYLTGYFQTDMESTGGIPTFKMIHYVDDFNDQAAKVDGQMENEYFQPMYVAEDSKREIELQGTFQYALFPDISTLSYDSHLAYIPHLNFAKWVTTLSPGTYDLEFVFGIRHEMARTSFKMIVTPESRQVASSYYDSLYARKVDAVTFPLASCQNKAGSIPNVSDLSQYGKLLKVDYSQTGDIMFPWPRDHEVQYNSASGYGIFERNGTLEVIQLEFRKLPSASRFEFHAIGNRPTHLTMLCPNQMSIQPEILDYGYEMNKENLYICHPW